MPQEMRSKRTQASQAAVSCCGAVAARGLQMIEEGEDGVRANIIDGQLRDRSIRVLCQEHEVEPESVSVGPQRVFAGSAHATQVTLKVRLDKAEERRLVSGAHCCFAPFM
jgi:hypothetical protein